MYWSVTGSSTAFRSFSSALGKHLTKYDHRLATASEVPGTMGVGVGSGVGVRVGFGVQVGVGGGAAVGVGVVGKTANPTDSSHSVST